MFFRRLVQISVYSMLVFSAAFFQNCTNTTFTSQSSTDENPKLGGGGVDGKVYASYGTCPTKPIGVVASASVSGDFKSAFLLTENCKTLSVPKPIDVTHIKISSSDKASFILDGRVYTSHPFSDGTAGAPAAAIQYPTLLSGYARTPAWKVAGVDYAVGVPTGAILKDPATLAGAGLIVDPINHSVTVTGSNITLDSFDFSRNGGWSVQVKGAVNTRIINSLFIETASQSQAPIRTDAAAANLYVGYTTIDGGGTAADPANGTLIEMNGKGLVTEYCWLKNAPSNIFVFGYSGAGAGDSATIRYNLVEDSGRHAGGGGAYLTILSGSFTYFQIAFNTSIQTPGLTGATGWNLDVPGGSLTAEIGNNVMVTTAANAASYLTSFGPGLGAAVNHDNYFDLTGAFGFAYPNASRYGTFNSNFNMKDGSALPTNP